MQETTPKNVYLTDYCPPDYLIPEVELHFDIREDVTRVRSKLGIERNPAASPDAPPLVLTGENMELVSLRLDDHVLSDTAYSLTDEHLTIDDVPRAFLLEVETAIDPQSNTALEGLYKSGDIYCTQNEPEGFRKITYFLDRPDVMSIYTTTIEADRCAMPILLSNGNEIECGDFPDGRHYVKWHDPFPKPTYLFAVVAGDLAMVEDRFITCSGREITIRIFVDKGNEDRCPHAVASLKKAMKWDEDTFGLEYDLDLFMIVAVDSFNFGAMENKGLNIFNSQCVLAKPETATDMDFQRIEGIIAHEYFHNWTGNRVTCRDWFQLTLKEGLTVFRDQEFSADVTSRPVKRIQDVIRLRESQFVEDGGPTAHPIKPVSYIEINNFYTNTVYQKGAEIIRMIQTFIDRDAFRRGIERYFELYDGQAVTTEDFIGVMEDVSDTEFAQFQNWYRQAGTPICRVASEFHADSHTYHLTVSQQGAPTSEYPADEPFHFPLKIGLLDRDGNDIPLRLTGDNDAVTTKTLHIRRRQETFVFENVAHKPVPSLLRDFSAPVKLDYRYEVDELTFLLAHDSNEFNRYEAGQRLATVELERGIADFQENRAFDWNGDILDACGRLLTDPGLDAAFVAMALVLPSVTTLVERMAVCDYDAAFTARKSMAAALAERHEETLCDLHERLRDDGEYRIDPGTIGRRSLRNAALGYLMRLERDAYFQIASQQCRTGRNMTDEMAALNMLCQWDRPDSRESVDAFYAKWRENSLVMNKWFAVQAGSRLENVLDRVRDLEADAVFDGTNPNKLRALYGTFAGNVVRFHEAAGSGYRFIADKVVAINSFNPSAAASLVLAFKKYARLDDGRKELMKAELERILDTEGLAKDVYEIVSKILGYN